MFCHFQTTTPISPNLITLDTSFEVEDFDPLNQNAKALPAAPVRSPPVLPLPFAASGQTSSMSAAGVNHATTSYRPVYPTTTAGMMPISAVCAGRQMQQQLRSRQENEADYELLRKYGLDKFSLSSGGAAGNAGSQVAEASIPSTARQRNWTDFE